MKDGNCTDLILPQNFSRLHSGEEFIRSKSLEAIEKSETLLAHVEMIESAMNALDYFARTHVAENEDQLTLQLLGIRLFNATASALKLALSGYYQNSALIQRDILETIFLLDYLTTDQKLIAEWRTGDKKVRIERFKPSVVRKTLEKRDGFTAGKRTAAYDLLSELAGHATYKGFRMLTPVTGGDAHCGPFFEITSLDALISELAKHCTQVLHAFMQYFDMRKRADFEIRISYIEHQRKWATNFLGAKFDNRDLERMRENIEKIPR